MITVCHRRLFHVTRAACIIGLFTITSTGCHNLRAMANNMTNGMCPPGMLDPALSQANNMQYGYQQQQYGQQVTPSYTQPAPIPTGSGMGTGNAGENCLAPPPQPFGATVESGQQSGETLKAIVGMAERLQLANDENVQLRKDLLHLQDEQQRHQEVAGKATEFADRLRSDNTRLKSDLTAWEDRLHQLEAMVESRESNQATALVDIDNQLDQLIAAYESDMDGLDR